MPTVETLLNDILNQDDAGVKSSFAAVMMEKVGEIIDSKKIEMSQSLFQTEGTFPPKKDDSDDEESDDKEDDSDDEDDSDEEEKSTKDDHLFKNTDKDDDSDDSDSSDDDKDVKTKKSGKKVTITVDEETEVNEETDDEGIARAAHAEGMRHGSQGTGNNMERAKKEWGAHFVHYNKGFLKGRNQKAKNLKAVGQGYGKKSGAGE